MNQSNQILLFDGVCNLCNGVVQFIIKHDKDGKFQYASLQSEFGQNILKKQGLSTNDFHSFIYIKDDKFYDKSTAALHISKDLGGFWKILYALIILPKPIRDFFYMLVSKNRYKMFGKQESCMLPTPELKARFLG